MANTCCDGTGKSAKRVRTATCCGETGATLPRSACCGAEAQAGESEDTSEIMPVSFEETWIVGKLSTPAGDVPQVATTLAFSDVLGSWKCRWSIGRMDYKVEPGVYA